MEKWYLMYLYVRFMPAVGMFMSFCIVWIERRVKNNFSKKLFNSNEGKNNQCVFGYIYHDFGTKAMSNTSYWNNTLPDIFI